MRRRTLIALVILPACTPDATTLATAGVTGSEPREPAAVALLRVSGDAADVFYGGTRLRRVSFGVAGGHGDPAGGTVEVTPWPAVRASDADVTTREAHDRRFQVTCLAVSGSRAWVGVRATGAVTAADPGGDVWYVEDGGAGGVDRVGVWVGLAPESCGTKPVMPWALPLEHGQLEVTAN